MPPKADVPVCLSHRIFPARAKAIWLRVPEFIGNADFSLQLRETGCSFCVSARIFRISESLRSAPARRRIKLLVKEANKGSLSIHFVRFLLRNVFSPARRIAGLL